MRVIKLLNWDYTENWTNYQNIYRLYKVASYHSHSQIYMVHWIHIKFHRVRCLDFSSWRPITKRGAHDSKSWPSNLTSVFDNKGFFELWQSTSMPNGIHSKVIRSEQSGKGLEYEYDGWLPGFVFISAKSFRAGVLELVCYSTSPS